MLDVIIQNQNDINLHVSEMKKDVKELKEKVFRNSTDIAYGKGVGKVLLILVGMASFIFGVIQYIINGK
jgi:hypothetical protein